MVHVISLNSAQKQWFRLRRIFLIFYPRQQQEASCHFVHSAWKLSPPRSTSSLGLLSIFQVTAGNIIVKLSAIRRVPFFPISNITFLTSSPYQVSSRYFQFLLTISLRPFQLGLPLGPKAKSKCFAFLLQQHYTSRTKLCSDYSCSPNYSKTLWLKTRAMLPSSLMLLWVRFLGRARGRWLPLVPQHLQLQVERLRWLWAGSPEADWVCYPHSLRIFLWVVST